MKIPRRDRTVVLFVGLLAACAPSRSPSLGLQPSVLGAVAVREDLLGHFVALIGPKAQLAPPYLGISDSNFFCLRSFIDRRNGETAHQLYVAASYEGKRDWRAAHDTDGQPLEFIPISRFKIGCEDGDRGCSYAEEFAAMLPGSDLHAKPQGFSVTFTDDAGQAQTVSVSAPQIAAQLGALAAEEKALRPPAAAGAAAAPPAGSHQP